MAKNRKKGKKDVAEVAPVAVEQAAVEQVEPMMDQASPQVYEKFNRTGMDLLTEATLGGGKALVVKQEEPKQNRKHTRGGYLGLAEDMFLAGNTGEDIIKAICAIYVEKHGKDEAYGLARGKKILQDIRREQAALKVAEKAAAA